MDLAPDPRARRGGGGDGRVFCAPIADRAGAADPDRHPHEPDRALRDRCQCLRLGRDHWTQRVPADVSAGRHGTFPVTGRVEPGAVHVRAQFLRRLRWAGARARAPLQAAADDRAVPVDRGRRDPGLRGRQADTGFVPADADPHRCGLRSAACAHRGCDPERGAAPPAWHLGRHHEFQPQPVLDLRGRGVRRHRARRHRSLAQRRAAAGRRPCRGGVRARVLRRRGQHVGRAGGARAHGGEAAADRRRAADVGS